METIDVALRILNELRKSYKGDAKWMQKLGVQSDLYLDLKELTLLNMKIVKPRKAMEIMAEILANCAESRDSAETPVQVRISGWVGNRDRVSLAIDDDGPGIKGDLLKQVANPFVTTRDGHLGIGLTRVETLLEMYGLSWELSSELGLGTSLTLEVGRFAGWMPERNLMKRKVGNG